jgi:hypothetical protein
MLKRPRRNFYLAYFLAALPDWMPRMPSKRFWLWTASVFSISFLSLLIGGTVIGVRDAGMDKIIGMSIAITIPVQLVGRMIHDWIDYRRKPPHEQRGFEVVPADKEAE